MFKEMNKKDMLITNGGKNSNTGSPSVVAISEVVLGISQFYASSGKKPISAGGGSSSYDAAHYISDIR